MRFKVDNMRCQHCVNAVTRAVQALDPAALVEVDLQRGELLTKGGFDAAAVIAALAEEDYPAQLLADG